MMSSRPYSSRIVAIRPVLEGLESRELLSHIAIPDNAKARIATISQLPTAPSQAVSTVPANGDVNPYGVAFVPRGFAGGGVLRAGDALVSNFNNSSNLQGTGSTIVRITPGGQQSVFYQGPPGVGLSTALGVLKRGYVIVGYVPSTDGTSATAQPGGILVLNSSGKVVANPTDPTLLDGPWGMTIADSGRTAKIFISDVLSGTVSRFNIKLTASGPQSQQSVQIASGYIHRGDPAAFEIGPTGLVFDAKSNTLYVASTGDNAIYAIRGAGTTRVDRGTGRVVYQDSTHLHGPLGMTMAPDGNLIAAQSDAVNSDPKQPSELVEFTTKGKFIGQFSISTEQGGAFGVATSSTRQQFAAVNDITNSVQIWTVRP
jgi:hypothetical protein